MAQNSSRPRSGTHNGAHSRPSGSHSRPISALRKPSDSALWSNFVDHGDNESLALLFDQKKEILHRIACRIVGNQADADDVIQISIEHLLASRPDTTVQSVQPWLVGVVLNQARMYVRRESRLRKRHDRAHGGNKIVGEGPTDRFEKNEMIALMEGVLNELPARYREPVVLHYIEGLKFQEIAEALELKEEIVKKQSQRGVSMMRTIMSKRGITASVLLLISWMQSLQASDLSPFMYTEISESAVEALVVDPSRVGTDITAGLSQGTLLTKLSIAAVVMASLALCVWIVSDGDTVAMPVVAETEKVGSAITSSALLSPRDNKKTEIPNHDDNNVGVKIGGNTQEGAEKDVREKEQKDNKDKDRVEPLEHWQKVPFEQLSTCPFGVLENVAKTFDFDADEQGETLWLLKPTGTYPTFMNMRQLDVTDACHIRFDIQVQAETAAKGQAGIMLYTSSENPDTVVQTNDKKLYQKYAQTPFAWHTIDIKMTKIHTVPKDDSPRLREISYFIDGELYWSKRTYASMQDIMPVSIQGASMLVRNFTYLDL